MDTLFYIGKNRTKEYPVIVYSSGYHQISDFIKQLETELKKKKYSGTVLFDLLLSNGLDNRFFTFSFNGEKFDYNSRKQVAKLPNSIIKKANNFQANNKVGIENSILSKSERKFISRQNNCKVDATQ
jgi:hypothetical protein